MAIESNFTSDTCNYLTRYCGCIIKPEYSASKYQQPGWPDRYLVHTLWCGWLEFKNINTPVEPIQRKRMSEIWARQPGTVFIVRKGEDERKNRIEYHADDSLIGVWLRPEELLLELYNLKLSLHAQHRKRFDETELIARDALLMRLKHK